MAHTLTIQDLVRETGLSDRTIKFYIAEGLMDGPDSPGRYATYGQRHLDRLKQIIDLTAQGFKLSAISAKLSPKETAASYVQRALHKMNLTLETDVKADEPVIDLKVEASGTKNGQDGTETWTRIRLTDGVELHVRTPLAEEMDEIVEMTRGYFRDQVNNARKKGS